MIKSQKATTIKFGSQQYRYCCSCGTALNPLYDADPNGEMQPQCAKCTAELAHDFDAEPGVKFTRGGQRIEREGNGRMSEENLRTVFEENILPSMRTRNRFGNYTNPVVATRWKYFKMGHEA